MIFPSSVPLTLIHVVEICQFIPPWIDKAQRESLLQKFDRVLQMVVSRPFQVVDGIPVPDGVCFAAMADALDELTGVFPLETILLVSNFQIDWWMIIQENTLPSTKMPSDLLSKSLCCS